MCSQHMLAAKQWKTKCKCEQNKTCSLSTRISDHIYEMPNYWTIKSVMHEWSVKHSKQLWGNLHNKRTVILDSSHSLVIIVSRYDIRMSIIQTYNTFELVLTNSAHIVVSPHTLFCFAVSLTYSTKDTEFNFVFLEVNTATAHG